MGLLNYCAIEYNQIKRLRQQFVCAKLITIKQRDTKRADQMTTIERAMENRRKVESIVIKQKDKEIGGLMLEVNGLKNAIRRLPECGETHDLRKRVGERRWENRVKEEYTGELAQAEQEHKQLILDKVAFRGR